MSDNSYDKAYEAGRSGGMYTGGNSIDYAGYAAGEAQRSRAEAQNYGGGGGGGPVNFKGRVFQAGIIFGMLGGFLVLLKTQTWWGGALGFLIFGLIGATMRVLLEALVRLIMMLFRFLPFAFPILVGSFLGAVVGAVASDQMHTPRDQTTIQYAVAGAAVFFALWALWKLLARKRSS